MSNSEPRWQVFQGDNVPSPDRINQLPPPPPWRQFRNPIDPDNPTQEQQAYLTKINTYWQALLTQSASDSNSRSRLRGENFRIRSDQERVIMSVNAALSLRRPLLITGRPGSGKTSLAYAIAHELQLGPVLMWPITARSTLEAGLYRYDAIARLQDAQLLKQRRETATEQHSSTTSEKLSTKTIGDYLQLGPLGTAFLPTPYPRVLIIDEVDKSNINLPNDLLNLLEEGQFEIPELVRLAQQDENSSSKISVRTDDDLPIDIEGGKIRCDAFPLIVMTSNGERDFPPAFLRRCLRIEMPKPQKDDLTNIVAAHLSDDILQQVEDLIGRFDSKINEQSIQLATDQLLNAVYLRKYGAALGENDDLEQLIFAALSNMGGLDDQPPS